VKVAIVGAGISGLVAARMLHLAGHQVCVFEAGDHVGGHANTIRVETESGAWNVDTGFVVLNDRNYPNLERLLNELAVPTQTAPMSFGVSDGDGRFEWAARPLGLFARPAHVIDPRFHRMLLDLVRFNREARGLIGLNGHGPSLRRFLADGRYSPYFVERFIAPQAAAIWSAHPEELWSFPASFLAEFFDNHGALQLLGRPRWRSITGGAARYVKALTAPFRDRVHLRTPVRTVRRDHAGVEIVLDDTVERADEVVIATHSDQALAMLALPTRAEEELLGAFPYRRNEVVLHTDTNLMPARRTAWASWNYHLDGGDDGATVTYHMNRLQALDADPQFLVTLNRSAAIDPGQVIRRLDYSHPVYTREGIAAQRRWEEISGRNRTHYCGAYWRWGFHEDGVWSAMRACATLAAGAPPDDDRATDGLAEALVVETG
jgi:predicted NAD/FAD-binding protein